MDTIHVRGGNPLFGEVRIQGSKNAVLPIMAAALLIDDICIIENCPRITDVGYMKQLLSEAGCFVSHTDRKLVIDARHATQDKMSREAVTGMRSSIMLLGSMLGRFGKVSMSYPGGCVIGKRPIDIHIHALKKMGVSIREEESGFTAKAGKLKGCVLRLPFASVGATENVILAAVKAEGDTYLYNAAKEPEIVSLCAFLNQAGAKITGAGSEVIKISGQRPLHGITYKVPADRIVAGTYVCSVLGAGGHVLLRDAPYREMESVLKVATLAGAEIAWSGEGLSVLMEQKPRPIANVKTAVYPGFPTDLQSPLLSALTAADGVSVLEETIFEDRFRIVGELKKMGADIRTDGRKAIVTGGNKLRGTVVSAGELRGGAGLVIAGCMADGETIITNRHFIDRGYEDICRDYQNLGVNIVTGKTG